MFLEFVEGPLWYAAVVIFFAGVRAAASGDSWRRSYRSICQPSRRVATS